MILTVDIGNSNIMFGCVTDEKIIFTENISSERIRTQVEYMITLKSLVELYDVQVTDFEGAIISSVVPELTHVIKSAIEKLLHVDAMVVGPGVKTGMDIRIDNPAQLGTDLLVNAVAAVSEHHGPIIIVDMGTATAFCVINGKNQYIGGILAPGIRISLDSLVSRTSLLPQITLEAPKNIIGKNTADCMKSGMLYSSAAIVDGVIERIEDEIKEKCTIIATGAPARAIIPCCKRKGIIIDEQLMLKGLKVIYDKNRK